ncbi:galactoside O-acetyltransferase [Lactococcus hodotermopsidis]|uniref:Acetyltransferase n=1 Tax=Pseudolactococcus hodotermopsidis TaxID=2709157 RepID=A0A6A0BED6_9LACT|nr:sugar O-acetyltransferase [Lactococcus hodotermopsidis]GFH43063.1 galactoside O-acetyltransferase [Lactococcus hodotermopsidis]
MTNLKRKMNGLPYHYDDPEIMGEQMTYLETLYDYNATRPTEHEKKQALLKKMFAEIGENCHIETPIHANWGCHNVHFGSGIYCNFNLTLVDDAEIWVGDNTMFGPNVVIATSGHPILPILRTNHYVYNLPVRIGKNVWIGAGVQILPDVTIGDNTVIGAGSVVTKDIPANVVAFGTPCQVVRQINEQDKLFYFKDRKLDIWA